MGIGTIGKPREEEKELRTLNILEPVMKPVIEAQRQFYRTNPQETLEIGVLYLFLITTTIGEYIGTLPIAWYIAFTVWIIGYFKWFGVVIKKSKKRSRPKKG
jgi:hypothetical protein